MSDAVPTEAAPTVPDPAGSVRTSVPLDNRPSAGTVATFLGAAMTAGVPVALRLVALDRTVWAAQVAGLAVVLAAPAVLSRSRRVFGLAVVAAITVLGLTLAAAGMGRAPVVVAALGAVAGVAVVDGWWSPPGWYRSGPVATIAAPLVVLGAVGWFTSGSLPLASVSYALAVAVVVLCGVRLTWVARLNSALESGLRRQGDRIATVCTALMTIPRRCVVDPARRSVPRRTGRRDRTGVSPDLLSAPGVSRRAGRWSGSAAVFAGAVVGLVGLVALVAGIGSTVFDPPPTGPSESAAGDLDSNGGRPAPESQGIMLDVPFAERPAFERQPDVDELEAEQRRLASSLVTDSQTLTGTPDFSGVTTNVEGGIRRTSISGCHGCPLVRLWIVGGSAAFGLGQRDDATIGSNLVRAAERDGISLEVVNLAVPGWTGWQGVEAVRERLGEMEPPDIVLVYDGFNDVVATVMSAVAPGGADRGDHPVISSRDIASLAGDWRSLSGAGDAATVGRRVAERHAVSRSALRAAASRVGADVIFVVQPDALASERQRRGAQQVVSPQLLADFDYLGAVLDASAAEMEDDGSWNLRRVLDRESDVVFSDMVHTNEHGAAVVAAEIYQRLGPRLRERVRTS